MSHNHLSTAPIVIVGAKDKKVNFTTIGDVAVVGLKPALVMISCHEKHYITKQINDRGVFSINVPDETMLAVVEYCYSHSGHVHDKSFLVEGFYEDIPYLKAPSVLFCKVVKKMKVEHREIFIAEIMSSKGELVKNPIIYSLDHQFHTLKSIEGL